MLSDGVIARSTGLAYWIVFAVALFVRWWVVFFADAISDDALIVMRVARNLAEGRGFVYNEGQRVLAVTSPLYTLAAAGIWSLCGESALIVARALGAVADAGTAVIVAALASRVGHLTAALVAGLTYALVSTVVLPVTSGLETGLYTLSIALTFLAMEKNQAILAAASASCAVLLRPDGLILLAIVFAVITWNTRKIPFKAILIAGAILSPWALFSLYYFGSPIPQTIVAKALLARSAGQQWGFILAKFFLGGVPRIAVGALCVTGAALVIRGREPSRLGTVLLWGACYIAAFSTAGVWWPWYLPPAVIPYAMLTGIGAAAVFRWARARWGLREGMAGVVMAAGLLLMAGQTVAHARDARYGAALYKSQRKEIASWIDRCSAGKASVFIEPMGMVGFFVHRPIQDYPGLASREVTAALSRLGRRVPGKPNDPQVVGAILAGVRPDILVLRRDEYAAVSRVASQAGYRLAHVVDATAAGARQFPDYQSMFILQRADAAIPDGVECRLGP